MKDRAGRPLTATLVGYGSVAQKHLRAIDALAGRLRLISICDPDAHARKRAQSTYDCACFPSLEESLKAHTPDLVILTSPSGLHPEQTAQAAAAGAHVLTEKPLALNVQAALEMKRACDRAGVSLHVIQQMRQLPTLIAAREAIRSGALGAISTSAVRVLWNRNQAYFDAAAWRGTTALDGGILLNQANHYLDLLIWLFGSPTSVMAELDTLQRDVQTPDTAAIVLRWPEHIATFHASLLSWPRNLEASLTVLGAEGTIKLDGQSLERISCWMTAEPCMDEASLTTLSQRDALARERGHLLAYERALDALMYAPQTSLTPFDQLLDVLYTIEAATRSSSLGRRVLLSELKGDS